MKQTIKFARNRMDYLDGSRWYYFENRKNGTTVRAGATR